MSADGGNSPAAEALTAPLTLARASENGLSNDTSSGAAAVRRARSGMRVTLPHKSAVESDFDQPLDHVEAYVGPDAERACDELGAEAFTFGNTIGFRSSHPDIRTVRHEVAHVIQQGGADRDHATPSAARFATLSPDSGAERAARSSEDSGAPAAIAATTTQSPTLALKLRKKATATTNQIVHLLKALGGAKLATLPQNTLVAVVEVLADGRAFRVYVPQLDLTGILPKHTLTELPHLEHIGGREFKNLRQPEGKPQSLEELAKQDPSLKFLAWSPAEEARKVEEAERAKTTERRAAVQSMTLSDIKQNWDKRSDDFLAVASDPANKLNGDQMYAIWLSYWMREQGAAHEAFRKAEERVRAEIGNGEFAIRMHYFKKGKRDIYGRDYETAANRKDAVDFMLMRLIGVRNWLQQSVDVMGKRVTLDEVNAKAYEIVKAHQDFQTYFAPFIYGLIGYGATLGAGTHPGSRPAPPQPGGPSKLSGATESPAPAKAGGPGGATPIERGRVYRAQREAAQKAEAGAEHQAARLGRTGTDDPAGVAPGPAPRAVEGTGGGKPPVVTKLSPGPKPPPEPMAVKERPLPEGTHKSSRTLKPRTASRTDPEMLRANMEAAGKSVPPGHDAHHMVLKKGGGWWGAQARRALQKVGIKINDPANGIALPGSNTERGTVFEPEGGPYHGTMHTPAYYKAVTERLRGAKSESEARAILRQIEDEIRFGSFPH